MKELKEDMDLSEFSDLVTATPLEESKWNVDVTLYDMEKITITVNNCYSEFEAKERVYLYLIDKIHNKEK